MGDPMVKKEKYFEGGTKFLEKSYKKSLFISKSSKSKKSSTISNFTISKDSRPQVERTVEH